MNVLKEMNPAWTHCNCTCIRFDGPLQANSLLICSSIAHYR